MVNPQDILMTSMVPQEASNPGPPDPSAHQRQAADPEANAWVSASAGSGKTKVLTDRLLNLLLCGVPLSRILCLTFTKAAAAEMSHRLLSVPPSIPVDTPQV